MHRPNPVQTIAQQRQQFALSQTGKPPADPTVEDDLAQEIYARLVAGHYLDTNYVTRLDAPHLQQLARAARDAAKAYFAVEEGTTNG